MQLCLHMFSIINKKENFVFARFVCILCCVLGKVHASSFYLFRRGKRRMRKQVESELHYIYTYVDEKRNRKSLAFFVGGGK